MFMIVPTWIVDVGDMRFRVAQNDLEGFTRVLIFNKLAFNVYRDEVEAARLGGMEFDQQIID